MCMWSNIERAEGWRKVRGKPTEWQYMYICIKYSIFPLCEPYTEKQNHPFLHEFLNICQDVIYPASQGLLFELLVQLIYNNKAK